MNTAHLDNEKLRTLGDLTPAELVESARKETVALGAYIDEKVLPMIEGQPGGGNAALVLRAYIGSIGSRLAVAQAKADEDEHVASGRVA